MAGFVDFEITWRKDVFADAPQAGSAANFGTMGINFRARKPVDEAEWHDALSELTCDTSHVVASPQPLLQANAFYDAGEQGCEYSVINDISAQMKELKSGQTMEIRATAPSVSVALPAWCRLACHEFVKQVGDRFLIRRMQPTFSF